MTLALPSAIARLAKLTIPLTLLTLTACGGCGSDDPNNDENNPTAADMKMDVEPDMKMPEPDMKVEEDMKMDVEPDMKMPEPDMKIDIPEGPEVKTVAFSVYPPYPVNCDEPNARYRIPFSVIAEELESKRRRPLKLYDRIGGRPVLSGETIGIGQVGTERLRIAQDSATSCVTNDDCSDGFKCSSGGDREASRICTRRTEIIFEPDSIRPDVNLADGEKEQLITVLVENSGSMFGYSPIEVGALFDENGEKDLFRDESRATDSNLSSRVHIRDFLTFIASYADGATSKLSVYTYGSDKAVDLAPLTKQSAGLSEEHFTSDLTEPIDKILNIADPNAQKGTGNVFQALHRVIDIEHSLDKYANHEKFVFVITDGPNEVWDADATENTVVRAAVQNGVKLFFIHFDPERDATLLRDPLAYWAGAKTCREDNNCITADPCASDDDCASYEECRNVTLYAETAEEDVSQTDLPYCVPKYRDDGRVGPVDEYSRLSCETGGNYIYLSSVPAMGPALKELPALIDGQWSMEAEISYLDVARAPAGFYRLSGYFLGLFGNSALGVKLSTDVVEPCFNDPAADCVTSRDNRPVIRLGQ